MDSAINCTTLIKKRGNRGPFISEIFAFIGLISESIIRCKARNMVVTIFCRRRKVEKYIKPIVNPDFICLYVLRYSLSKKSNKKMLTIPMAKANTDNDKPSSPFIMVSSI